MVATGIRRYCPITSTRMCLELHSGQLLGLLWEQLALVLEWVLLQQAELMFVLVAPLQAELVLLLVLAVALVQVAALLPVLAVGQMWVPRLSPEVMKALKLVAELQRLVAVAAH